LRPFSAELFSEIRGLDRNIEKNLGESAQNAIWIWRSFLCLSVLQPEDYVRLLPQLLTSRPSVLVNFDASLVGLGIRLFHLSPEGIVGFCFCIVWVDMTSAGFQFSQRQDSAYQNSVEFMAMTCALLTLTRMGFSDVTVRLCGDSVSALTWATTRSFRRGRSFRTACVQTEVGLRTNIAIDLAYDFVQGELNYDTDYISRNGDTGKETKSGVRSRYPSSLFQCVEFQPWLTDISMVCNPETEISSIDSMCAFWGEVRRLVNRTMSMGALAVPPVPTIRQCGLLQLFVSASIRDRPVTCHNKRPAWTLEAPAQASILEILRLIWSEYGVKDEGIFRVYAPRIHVYLTLPQHRNCLGVDVGLKNGDVVQLVGGLLGGMDLKNKRKALNSIDATLARWGEFVNETSLIQTTLVTASVDDSMHSSGLPRVPLNSTLWGEGESAAIFLRPGDLDRVVQLKGGCERHPRRIQSSLDILGKFHQISWPT